VPSITVGPPTGRIAKRRSPQCGRRGKPIDARCQVLLSSLLMYTASSVAAKSPRGISEFGATTQRIQIAVRSAIPSLMSDSKCHCQAAGYSFAPPAPRAEHSRPPFFRSRPARPQRLNLCRAPRCAELCRQSSVSLVTASVILPAAPPRSQRSCRSQKLCLAPSPRKPDPRGLQFACSFFR